MRRIQCLGVGRPCPAYWYHEGPGRPHKRCPRCEERRRWLVAERTEKCVVCGKLLVHKKGAGPPAHHLREDLLAPSRTFHQPAAEVRMSLLFLDFETRSLTDLPSVGSYRYAADPSTKVLCAAFALDDAPAALMPAPSFVALDALLSGSTAVCHNAEFEKSILRHVFGIDLPIDRFIDTAAMSARMSLPRKLEDVARYFGLDTGAKDEGKKAIQRLCKPQKGRWIERDERPDLYAMLEARCVQDVELTRTIYKRLLPLEPQEKRIWQVTLEMNERGLKIDRAAIAPAQAVLEKDTAPLVKEFEVLVGQKVKSYQRVAAALGLPDMRKPTVRKALRDGFFEWETKDEAGVKTQHSIEVTPRTRRALEIFQALSKSSVAKLEAMLDRMGEGDRVRGSFVYCGAERTGRWSASGLQPQNFPRGLGHDTDTAFAALFAGVLEEMFVGAERTHPELPLTPTSTVANMLRGFITGPLIVGDLSQIEARALNWLAGQEDTVELFASGGDPYCAMASKIYGRPISKKHDPDERFMGKQAILGCFAADTMVLTDTGWRPIVDVRSSDKLWDGEAWVSHGGVVCQGEKDVLFWQEIGVTPDHLLLTRGGWEPASQVVLGKDLLLASALSSGNSAWKATSSAPGEESPRCEFPARVIARGSIPSIRTTSDEELLRAAMLARNEKLSSLRAKCIGGMPTSCPTPRTGSASSTESPVASLGATTPATRATSTMAGGGSSSTSSGASTEAPSCATCSHCRAGSEPSSSSTEKMSTAGMNLEICASSPAPRTCPTDGRCPSCNTESPSSKRKCVTYDIASAGPRSRFTILTAAGPVVAHNCGYGLGAGGFQFMLDDIYDRQIDLDFAQQVVDAYRAASPKVVSFWKRLNEGLTFVVQAKKDRVQVTRNLAMGMTAVGGMPYAFIELPSGRRLYYARPRVVLKTPKWKGAVPRLVVEYFGREKFSKGWGPVTTYGGKISENVTQAFSRDVIAAGMLRLRDAGFHLNGTVHDETIAEDEATEENVKRFKELLVQVPEWAPGLPLDAEVFSGVRYRK